MLFTVWSQRPHRATKDIDLLGYGAADTDRLSRVFHEICKQEIDHDDGVEFLGDTIRADAIREDAVYDGIRVRFTAKLGNARIPVQVDVGFGDATAVPQHTVELPPLLDFPAPELICYSREVVVAEKLHAMVDRGLFRTLPISRRFATVRDICCIFEPFPGAERAVAEWRASALQPCARSVAPRFAGRSVARALRC